VDLKRFHDRAAALKIKRNMLAHGLWGRMPREDIWKVFYQRDTDEHDIAEARRTDGGGR